MFYCNKCANENGYPITMFRSRGTCEVCKETADCNEMPSKDLLLPQQKESVESKREGK